MKLIIRFSTVFLFIWFLIACGSDKDSSSTSQDSKIEISKPAEETVKFNTVPITNAYPDAILELYTPLQNESFKEGKVPFEFNIKNFPFEDGVEGFQLKMIINGNDPVGYNMPLFQKDLERGTYRAVAYLVDEEGVALKEYGNYVDRDFTVGESNPFPETGEPSLALNMPVNDQIFLKGEPVLVDFLLIGGDLEEAGLQVEISVNGNQFTLQKVTPVEIKGLSSGSYQLSVALINEKGKELEGVFSKVQKQIEVK